MDLEKSYRLQLQEAIAMEPVNNMGKWAKQTKIDSIKEKIQWIENVTDVAKGDFDFGSGLDKDSWIAEENEIDIESLENQIKEE
jgi:hypothetical protein